MLPQDILIILSYRQFPHQSWPGHMTEWGRQIIYSSHAPSHVCSALSPCQSSVDNKVKSQPKMYLGHTSRLCGSHSQQGIIHHLPTLFTRSCGLSWKVTALSFSSALLRNISPAPQAHALTIGQARTDNSAQCIPPFHLFKLCRILLITFNHMEFLQRSTNLTHLIYLTLFFLRLHCCIRNTVWFRKVQFCQNVINLFPPVPLTGSTKAVPCVIMLM